MNVLKPMTVCASLISVGCAMGATYVEDVTYDSDKVWTVEKGCSDVMEGVVAARGTFTLSGGGTLTLTRGENSFDKPPILVSYGSLCAQAAGAFGTAQVSLSCNSVNYSRVLFDCEGAIFENAVHCGGGTQTDYASAPIFFRKSSTLAGDVTFTGNKLFAIADDANVCPTTVFNGMLTASQNYPAVYISVYPAGTMKFMEKVTVPVLGLASSSPGVVGRVEFHASGNDVLKLAVGYPEVHLYATNAFLPKAILSWEYAAGAVAADSACGKVVLHSDQEFGALAWKNEKYPSATSGAIVTAPDGPVSFGFTGSDDGETARARLSYARFEDGITLVKRGSADQLQELAARTHTTTGEVYVLGGTLRLSSGTTFPAVPAVVVNGGTIDVQSTASGVFAGLSRITVSNGVFSIGANVPSPLPKTVSLIALGNGGCLQSASALSVKAEKLVINDEDVGYGVFSMADYPENIGMNVLIVVERPARDLTEDSWKGGSAGDAVSAGENWNAGKTPDLNTGDFLPFFSCFGSRMVLDRDVSFRGMTFAVTNAPSFMLESASDAYVISLGEEGVVARSILKDSVPLLRAYTNAAPTVLSVPEQVWDIGAGATFISAAEVSATAFSDVAKVGVGALALDGAWKVPGDFTLSEGTMIVRGVFGVDGEIGGLSVDSRSSMLRLENANVFKSFENIAGGISENPYWLTVGAGTTNIIHGAYVSRPSQYFTMEENSELVFGGGIELGADFIVVSAPGGSARGARFVVRDVPLVADTIGRGSSSLDVDVVFDAVGNRLSGSLSTPGDGRFISFERDRAFDFCPLLTANGGEIRLNGTWQRFGCIRATARRNGHGQTVVVGTSGSCLEVTDGGNGDNVGMDYCDCSFVGFSSLMMGGSGLLFLTNAVSASSGSVSVTNGVLCFAADASWPNCTNVVVSGSGRLSLTEPKGAFGRNVTLSLKDEGVLSVPVGRCLRVSDLLADDVHVPAGTYSYATCPYPELRRHLDPDGGSVAVKGGIVLLVR